MKHWMEWLLLAVVPAALAMILLTGCQSVNTVEIWEEDGMTVYALDGLEVPVPSEYRELLTVVFSDPADTYDEIQSGSGHIQTLFSCREKARVEAGKREHPGEDHGEGWLFSICRLDQEGLEDWLVSDGFGSYLFAQDNAGGYYLSVFPTDIRFDREEAEARSASEEWELWYRLNEWSATVPDEIVKRGGTLKPYDAFALYRRDYTYDGNHEEITCELADGTGATLVLSQPVRQGRDGIWCVERVRYDCDGWTDTRLNFPIGEGIDMAADAYYTKLQAESEKHPELLTPMGAALAYARGNGWVDSPEEEAEFLLLSAS